MKKILFLMLMLLTMGVSGFAQSTLTVGPTARRLTSMCPSMAFMQTHICAARPSILQVCSPVRQTLPEKAFWV